MRVALVLGHSPTSKGASNESGMNEYDFNSYFIHNVRRTLENTNVDVVIVERDTYKGLPNKINAENPDLIISFHCNAFNTHISGSEVLYYHTSKKGKYYAKALLSRIVRILSLPDRGTKAITSEDRGGYLLHYTHAPCIIAEPFFIDNTDDLNRVEMLESELIEGYKQFILWAAKEFSDNVN